MKEACKEIKSVLQHSHKLRMQERYVKKMRRRAYKFALCEYKIVELMFSEPGEYVGVVGPLRRGAIERMALKAADEALQRR